MVLRIQTFKTTDTETTLTNHIGGSLNTMCNEVYHPVSLYVQSTLTCG